MDHGNRVHKKKRKLVAVLSSLEQLPFQRAMTSIVAVLRTDTATSIRWQRNGPSGVGTIERMGI